jgi:hypothetical protein
MSAISANGGGDLRCGDREQSCGYWTRLVEVVRQIFPTKPAPNLAVVAGVSLRTSEYFFEQKRGLSGDAVVSLLNTEHGPEVLAALTEHSDQEWAKAFQKWWKLQKLKAAHAEMQKQIDELSK